MCPHLPRPRPPSNTPANKPSNNTMKQPQPRRGRKPSASKSKKSKKSKPTTQATPQRPPRPPTPTPPPPPAPAPAPAQPPTTVARRNSFNIPIHPPKRSFWTPFSHASTEINLFARPDFHNVCHAVYQTFHLGALFPNRNPPPVTLPLLELVEKTETSLSIQQDQPTGHHQSPAPFPQPPPQRIPQPIPPSTPQRSPRSRILTSPNLSSLPTPLPTPPSTPKTPKTDAPDDSPWATFVFSPKPIVFSTKPLKPSIHSKPGMQSQAPLLEIFSAKVPMTPVRARSDSPYVSTREHSVHIHPIAYAQDNGKGPQILCKAIINPSYRPDVADGGRIIPTLTYVGFEYCDQTCLTYVPIKDTRLVYRMSCRKERWFGEDVQMIMRRSVYERIKEMSIRAYLESNPGVKVDCGSVEFQGVNVMLLVMVKANRTVRIELDNATVYRPLLATLDACKHDIFGEGLMHVRFSKVPGKEVAQLKFILFGIQATRTEANRTLRIFQIAENEKKDDKKGDKH